nr:MAG TPA: hypothetical protein [Caudoviricetes sp.]
MYIKKASYRLVKCPCSARSNLSLTIIAPLTVRLCAFFSDWL